MAKQAKKSIAKVVGETELVEVTFVKSAFGKFNLPYYIGQKVKLKQSIAKDLMEGGFIK